MKTSTQHGGSAGDGGDVGPTLNGALALARASARDAAEPLTRRDAYRWAAVAGTQGEPHT